MKVRRLLVAAAVVCMVAACTSETTGSPSPQNTGRSSTSAPPTTSTSSSRSTEHPLPPRPRDLDISGVNPCTDVLTRDQLRKLAYDLGYLEKPIAGKSPIHGGPLCGYASSNPPDQLSRDLGSLVIISTSEGADVWLTDPQRKRPPDKYHLATIAGFPALVLPNPVIVTNCAIVVDVHDGQYLQVDSSSNDGKGTSPDPYCAEAQRVAGMVMENLLARR